MHVNRNDRGVTLIEVMIAIILMTIILVPLGNALIAFLRNTNETTARLSESHDVQISSAYFAQDVESTGTHDWTAYPYDLTQSVETNVAPTTGVHPCGLVGTPNALVRLAWDDPTVAVGSPTVVRVAYVVETVGSERQLHRIACTTASLTPTSDLIVVHNLDSTNPTVTCSTTCGSAPDVPQSLTMTLVIKDPKDTGSALTIVLKGQRRQT